MTAVWGPWCGLTMTSGWWLGTQEGLLSTGRPTWTMSSCSRHTRILYAASGTPICVTVLFTSSLSPPLSPPPPLTLATHFWYYGNHTGIIRGYPYVDVVAFLWLTLSSIPGGPGALAGPFSFGHVSWCLWCVVKGSAALLSLSTSLLSPNSF